MNEANTCRKFVVPKFKPLDGITSADFFEQHEPEARQILTELLEKYVEHGAAPFVLPGVLKVPPVSDHGQSGDITKPFRRRGQTPRRSE